ncbi:MAG: double-cubane-cluster-containing anaerobic reductase [Planctomycetota bacterium]|jgi:benzoyl-CoA reductase/2-hydroxyglutaryl-CoA dehydratase subunit BcrC/BadD/HgdB
MPYEINFIHDAKKQGKGVAGIYCEYTPRELFLAAGAYPVCLCGTNRTTIPPAEAVLPANLCPLIKSSFGYIITNKCPFFSDADVIVAETTCDGKKKMYELISDKKPIHVLELTQKVEEKEAWDHWLVEVRKLKERLEEVYKTEITDEKLSAAIKQMNNERKLLREAFELGMEDPPIVTGLELSEVRYRVAGMPDHMKMLEKFIGEIRTRKERAEFAAPKGTPRILLTGVPTGQGTTKMIEIIEECGAVVAVQESCSGWKPLDELTAENGNPLEAIARKHFNLPCSCMTPNSGRPEMIRKLVKNFRIDAVVDLVWQACHTYNVEAFLIEKFVREELGLQYLKVETDYSDSDREQIKVRLQTLIEMI